MSSSQGQVKVTKTVRQSNSQKAQHQRLQKLQVKTKVVNCQKLLTCPESKFGKKNLICINKNPFCLFSCFIGLERERKGERGRERDIIQTHQTVFSMCCNYKKKKTNHHNKQTRRKSALQWKLVQQKLTLCWFMQKSTLCSWYSTEW